MAVPGALSLMLPVLKLASNGKEQIYRTTVEALATQFALNEEDRKELLPSGTDYRFDNNVSWATSYLKKAGLLIKTGRGKYQITDRGLEVLKRNPQKIDINFLKEFPEFQEFIKPHKAGAHSAVEEEEGELSPEAALEESYQKIRKLLADEILEKVKGCPPKFFEKLVVDLLYEMSYGGSREDAQAVGRSGDVALMELLNKIGWV
jgi:restriction system protein